LPNCQVAGSPEAAAEDTRIPQAGQRNSLSNQRSAFSFQRSEVRGQQSEISDQRTDRLLKKVHMQGGERKAE
jgi:hypothetical protein